MGIDDGTLRDLMNARPISEKLAANFTSQIVRGLDYLHRKACIHRDIKPSNILITSIGVIKIADFGSSKFLNDRSTFNATHATTIKGTIMYLAPEVIQRCEYRKECDIWSLGSVIFEMMTNKRICEEKTRVGIYKWKRDINNKLVLPDGLSELSKDIMSKCLKINPAKRPSCDQLFKHEWFQEQGSFERWVKLQKLLEDDSDCKQTEAELAAEALKQIKEDTFCEKVSKKRRQIFGGLLLFFTVGAIVAVCVRIAFKSAPKANNLIPDEPDFLDRTHSRETELRDRTHSRKEQTSTQFEKPLKKLKMQKVPNTAGPQEEPVDTNEKPCDTIENSDDATQKPDDANNPNHSPRWWWPSVLFSECRRSWKQMPSVLFSECHQFCFGVVLGFVLFLVAYLFFGTDAPPAPYQREVGPTTGIPLMWERAKVQPKCKFEEVAKYRPWFARFFVGKTCGTSPPNGAAKIQPWFARFFARKTGGASPLDAGEATARIIGGQKCGWSVEPSSSLWRNFFSSRIVTFNERAMFLFGAFWIIITQILKSIVKRGNEVS